MPDRTMPDEKILRRAIWGGWSGLAILLVSAGVADEGLRRVLEIVVGLAFLAAASTRLSAGLASWATKRRGGRYLRFSAFWISISAIVVPLLLVYLLAPVLLGSGSPDPAFTSVLIGSAICGLLNLVVVVINLFDLRAA